MEWAFHAESMHCWVQIDFKLKESGMMKKFEGIWHIQPFNQATLDQHFGGERRKVTGPLNALKGLQKREFPSLLEAWNMHLKALRSQHEWYKLQKPLWENIKSHEGRNWGYKGSQLMQSILNWSSHAFQSRLSHVTCGHSNMDQRNTCWTIGPDYCAMSISNKCRCRSIAEHQVEKQCIKVRLFWIAHYILGFQGERVKASSSLLTLEQSVVPNVVPPKPLEGLLKGKPPWARQYCRKFFLKCDIFQLFASCMCQKDSKRCAILQYVMAFCRDMDKYPWCV